MRSGTVSKGGDLTLKRTWVVQQDNAPKHTSKATSECPKQNRIKTLEWPILSPDLNHTEMLTLKRQFILKKNLQCG